jgi:endonuclease YncB( thermonuclease family)
MRKGIAQAIRVKVPAWIVIAPWIGLGVWTAWPPQIAVKDGDTLYYGAREVRLLGFDAPEMRPRCSREIAKKATARMAELIARTDIRLAFEPGLDKYKRLKARLYVGGRDAAEIMIGEGLAHAYDGRSKRPDWCR